jgi:hypothetical protein
MFDPTTPIPWDHPVEIFEVMSNLRVKSIGMTLRQAIEVFRGMPEDARWSLGVGLERSVELHMASGRPVAVGFLNASALAELAEMLPPL